MLADQAERPKNPIVSYVRQRLWRWNQNYICIFVGPTGSGKSYSGISFAEQIDPNFNIDKIFFKISDFVQAVADEAIKRGSCVVIDEAGIQWGSRSFMTQENKDMSALFQAVRFMNFGIVLTVPNMTMVDKHGRDLLHATVRTMSINRKEQYVKAQYRIQNTDPMSTKYYRVYPRLRDIAGTLNRVVYMNFYKPSEEIIKQYEKKKKEFGRKLFTDMAQRMAGLQDNGVQAIPIIQCNKCGYQWGYKGKAKRPRCPSCLKDLGMRK